MKTMISVLALTCLIAPFSLAEGKEGKGKKSKVDWAEKAALEYLEKAEAATASGNDEAARIYKRMAQIKLDAGKASKRGKEFSWKEYEELQGQLHKAKQAKDLELKQHDNLEKKQDYDPLQAAIAYEIKAAMAKELGNESDAKIYARLAEIKRSAAKGELKNWDEYHELSAQLSDHKAADKQVAHKDHKGKKGYDKNQDKGKPQNGFLDAAADYQMKATKAMAEGNEHNARIYTQLANIKREAAAAAAEGKGYDWTNYFALQKELK